MKTILSQSGVTSDNKKVISGIYKIFESHGIPLDIIFSILKEKNVIPDWIDFYRSARKVGMSHDRIISKLEEAINDSYGKEFGIQVIYNLNLIFRGTI